MLICGDALEELKKIESDTIDITVTSPPYNKQENKRGWLVTNILYDVTSDKVDEKLYQQN